jgi:excisionase family DNA binding protein
MAYPIRISPWSDGKPPQAVRQASGRPSPAASGGGADEITRLPVSPLLLTAEQAASALSICRTKVYELLRTGQLESVQIGSSRRIPVAALDDYVERLRRSSEFHAQKLWDADRSAS